LQQLKIIGTPVALAALAALTLLVLPPVHQDPAYHNFADSRTLLGIPNFWNVITNLPFVLAGLVGLRKCPGFANAVLFSGLLLTGLGSAYYHLSPSDQTLLWDRLPMTIVFMSILAIVKGADRWLLLTLVGLGIASVLWWRYSGDLRLYGVVQFGPGLLLLPALRSSPGKSYLRVITILYVLAKIAEGFDGSIYLYLPLSGHSLKHLLAGTSAIWMFLWRSAAAKTARKDPGSSPARA
jgi:hypothetical protein